MNWKEIHILQSKWIEKKVKPFEKYVEMPNR